MSWEIVEGPSAASNERGNTVWTFEIERKGERRSVTVENALSPDEVVQDVAESVARAIHTRGRSAVEAVLGEEAPASRLQISAYGVVRHLTTIQRRRRWFGTS